MVEVRVVGFLFFVLDAVPAVADYVRAERHRLVLRFVEVQRFGVFRLDQQDVAFGARRRDHVEVERDLTRPARVRFRIFFCFARLVDLFEAPARFRAFRHFVSFSIHFQVGVRVRIVERVDDHDRLARAAGFRHVVGGAQVSRREAAAFTAAFELRTDRVARRRRDRRDVDRHALRARARRRSAHGVRAVRVRQRESGGAGARRYAERCHRSGHDDAGDANSPSRTEPAHRDTRPASTPAPAHIDHSAHPTHLLVCGRSIAPRERASTRPILKKRSKMTRSASGQDQPRRLVSHRVHRSFAEASQPKRDGRLSSAHRPNHSASWKHFLLSAALDL